MTELSHVRGADRPPAAGDHHRRGAGARRGAVAASARRWSRVAPGRALDLAELAARADALAAGLLALGLEPGDRIGIWSPNCAEWALTQFATAKAGLILVNINPAYRLPSSNTR